MVKGPVPVSPAIAATFNAMTPSGAQLTSFFFFFFFFYFFFFFQLPKKTSTKPHTKERAVMILTTLELLRNPSQSERQKEWGPKSLYPIAHLPLPPPPHAHTQVQRRRGSSRTPRASKLRSKEKAQIHTHAQKKQKETKKGDENTRRKIGTESLNWGWKSDVGILLGGVSVRLLLNLGAISNFSSTRRGPNIHL
jgi:hypothetical protein